MSRRPKTAKINLERNRHVLNSRAALQDEPSWILENGSYFDACCVYREYIASYSSILLKPVKMLDFEKKHKQFAISLYRYTEIPFCFRLKTWSYSIVHYRQFPAVTPQKQKKRSPKSVLWAVKRHNKCPQGSKLWCLDLAIDNAFWVIFNFVE